MCLLTWWKGTPLKRSQVEILFKEFPSQYLVTTVIVIACFNIKVPLMTDQVQPFVMPLKASLNYLLQTNNRPSLYLFSIFF